MCNKIIKRNQPFPSKNSTKTSFTLPFCYLRLVCDQNSQTTHTLNAPAHDNTVCDFQSIHINKSKLWLLGVVSFFLHIQRCLVEVRIHFYNPLYPLQSVNTVLYCDTWVPVAVKLSVYTSTNQSYHYTRRKCLFLIPNTKRLKDLSLQN